MHPKRLFWFRLQSLVCELQQEGDSDFERALSVAEMLAAMTPEDRADCLADLEQASSMLSELTAVVGGSGGTSLRSCEGSAEADRGQVAGP